MKCLLFNILEMNLKDLSSVLRGKGYEFMKLLWKTLIVSSALGSIPITVYSEKVSELRDSIPEAWTYVPEQTTSLPSDDQWWEGFDDPELTSLIKLGENNSFNLSMALHRIEMARQNWEAAKAAYYPTIGISAGWTKEQQSGVTSTHTGKAMGLDYFSLGLNFSWEIDVFGKVREQSKEGKASYNASKAEYSAAMVSLCSNIATAYFNYRLAQQRINVAQQQIESQERISKITEARYETGLASKLDVAQSLTVLYSTQASLPALINMRTAALNSIALLTGCYPDKIKDDLLAERELPNAFRMVKIGVPADLLRRRPDILQAEYELAGYAAQVGVAKKDFLPVLTLNGAIGTSAHKIDDLFNKNSFTYSVAPQLSWTIFEGLARNHRLAAAKEQMLAGIDNYNLTVMNAVIETENALSTYDSALRQISLYRKVLKESQEAFSLAVDRYKRGLSSFTDVMNAQISLLDYENTLLETRAAALTSLIKVYAAVAGNPAEIIENN